MKNKIRQFGLPGFELGDYIREAIDFLRQHEPPEGYYVGFSGGKDSITTFELCRMAGVKHNAYYSCTRIDPPEMYAFIKANYPDVKWLFPKKSFYELIQMNNPPMRTQRWCCDALKKNPGVKVPIKYRVMGIRAEESIKRKSRPRIDKYLKDKLLLKPIFYWPEWAVWDFIEARKLSYPILYDQGLGRIGCVTCPFIFGTKRVFLYQNRWPQLWKAFKCAVARWYKSKRDESMKNFDIWWNAYITGKYLPRSEE